MNTLRKIILKGNLYQFDDIVVMATETTCNFTTKCFKGVVVKSNKQYPVGQYIEDWLIQNCKEVEKNEAI